jgi:hypothetical protein
MEDTPDTDGGIVPAEVAESFLDTGERLALLALEDDWDRWFWYDRERILLESSDLFAPVMLRPPTLGLGTFETVARDMPFALRAWENTDKLYLASHDDNREDATMRYIVDVATPEREIAEWFVALKGGGKIRTRDVMLSDPWPSQKHPVPLGNPPSLADALEDWDGGDDEIQHAITRGHAAEVDLLGKVKERRAKLRWGMIPGVEQSAPFPSFRSEVVPDGP